MRRRNDHHAETAPREAVKRRSCQRRAAALYCGMDGPPCWLARAVGERRCVAPLRGPSCDQAAALPQPKAGVYHAGALQHTLAADGGHEAKRMEGHP